MISQKAHEIKRQSGKKNFPAGGSPKKKPDGSRRPAGGFEAQRLFAAANLQSVMRKIFVFAR
jgi:hypothetical protein